MAAKVYSCPDFMLEPSFDNYKNDNHGYDIDAYFKDCELHTADLSQWIKDSLPGPHLANSVLGEVIRFGVADGYATYMVYKEKPLQLIHLDYGDGYHINDMMLRGLRLSDVRDMVNRDKRLAELFSQPKTEV